jgi:mono/diheme cytochrome c family protein
VADSIMPPFDFLPEAERDALVAFLMDQKYVVKTAPDLPPAGRAKKQFEAYCSSCHGETGNGLGPVAAALDPKPKNFQKRPFVGAYGERFEASIQKGIPGTAMPVWEKILSEQDVKGMVAYVRDEIAKVRPGEYERETVKAPPPAKDPFAAYLRGRNLFAEYCTGCHGRQGSGKGPNAYDLLAAGRVVKGKPQGEILPRNLRNPLYYGKGGVLTRERVHASILLGAPGSAMPAWSSLPARDVADLVAFVLQVNNAAFEKRAKESP